MDTRYLFKRGSNWWIRKRVPRALVETVGTRMLQASLGTSDMGRAVALRDILLREWEQASIGAVSARYRSALMSVKGKEQGALERLVESIQDSIDIERSTGSDAFDHVPGYLQYMAAKEVLTGDRDPEYAYTLSDALGDYSETKEYKALASKTQASYGLSVKRWRAWSQEHRLEYITRGEAVRWVDSLKETYSYSRRVHLIAPLAVMHEWAKDRELISEDKANPWRAIKHGSKNQSKVYTYMPDVLLIDILKTMSDIDRLPAFVCRLMGTRIEEVYTARYEVFDGVECIRTGVKTEAGKDRLVPIHSAIKTQVVDWLQGRKVLSGSKTSQAYSKKFGYAKRGLGVDDRSLSLHSCRVAFITDAKNSVTSTGDLDTNTKVAWVVGHQADRATQTDQYHRGYPIEALVEIVESVQPKELLLFLSREQ